MRYLLPLLLLTAVACAFPPLSVEEVVSLADHNTLTPKMVPTEIRNEVIVRLRAKLRLTDEYGFIPHDVCESLVALGDEQTIERVMHEFRENARKGTGTQSLGNNVYPQPLLIPYLAENFFLEDGDVIDTDKIWVSSSNLQFSIASILDVFGIIRRSSAFNADLKEWVKAEPSIPLRILDVPKCREVMRTWWRENEEHFAKRNYAAVKPGAPLGKNLVKADASKDDAFYRAWLAASASDADSTQTPTAPNSRDQVISSGSVDHSSEPQTLSTGTDPHPFLITAAITLSVLATVAGFFALRRKKEQ